MAKKKSPSMEDMVLFHPSFTIDFDPGDCDADLDEVRVAIECLEGEVTADPSEATHEFVEGDATTTLPRMDRAEVESRVSQAMAELMEKAPKPKVALVPIFNYDKPTQAPISQYFGQPWMPSDVDWPLYEDTPMDFVLQIDLGSLPGSEGVTTSLPSTGLLTLFVARETYDPEGGDNHVVIYPTDVPGDRRQRPDDEAPLEARYIDKWVPVLDHVTREDLDEDEVPFIDILEITSSTTIGEVLTTDGEEVPMKDAITAGASYLHHNFECDKLGGWPAWKQGPEWPEDSDGNRMDMVYQVSSDDGMILGGICLDGIDFQNHPATGRGHIFYSPSTGELHYGWA